MDKDFAASLKAAGFSLAQRKHIDLQATALSALSATLSSLLGPSFSLNVDWPSVHAATAKAADDSADRLLRALFEVLLPGLRADVDSMGAEELAALAGEFSGLLLRASPDASLSFSAGPDKRVLVLFGASARRFAYPSFNANASLRAFVLDKCEGSAAPSAVLPPSSLARRQGPLPALAVQFESEPPSVAAPLPGWIALPAARDPRQAPDAWAVCAAAVAAVRDAKEAGTELLLTSGATLHTKVPYADVMQAMQIRK